MRAVKSSALEAVGHDGDALIVRFRGGREYRYPRAPAHLVDAIAEADSPGRYFHEHVTLAGHRAEGAT